MYLGRGGWNRSCQNAARSRSRGGLRAKADGLRPRAYEVPLVVAALARFPGAEIKAVRPLSEAPAPPPPDDDEADAAAGAAWSDDWSPLDPFEED
jgi:hypothetical protein